MMNKNKIIAWFLTYITFCMTCTAPPALAGSPFIWGADSRAQGLQSSGVLLSNNQTIDTDGQRNYIKNNNGVTTLGYVDSGTGTTVSSTSTAADIPLYPYVDRAIRIVNDGSSTGYTYYQYQLAPNDLNRLLSLCWEQKPGSAYASGDFTVEVWADDNSGFSTPVELSLSTDDSSGLSAIANFSGQFCTTYSTNSTDSYIQWRIVRAAGSSGANSGLALNNIVTGPGIPAKGAIVGDWVSFTPTGSWTSNTTYFGEYLRIGSSIVIRYKLVLSGAPTSANLTLNPPSGLTFSSINTGVQIAGTVHYVVSGVRYIGQALFGSTLDIRWLATGASSGAAIPINITNATDPTTWGSGSEINLYTYPLPINEWAGSGTVNLAQNNVQYACSTTGTWDAAAAAANTVYGPSGCPISGALTANRTKVVQLASPLQFGESPTLQLLFNGIWTDASQLYPPTAANGVGYGAQNVGVSSTQVSAVFYRYVDANSAVTYGASGGAWPGGASAWRFVIGKSGSPVGFGVVSQNSSGLMPPFSSQLDDVIATRMGLKVYQHGTAYNGGNAPTITWTFGGGTLSSVATSSFMPYQMQGGNWRLKFTATVLVSSSTRTGGGITVAGIITPNLSNGYQAVSGYSNSTAGYTSQAFIDANASEFYIQHASSTTTTYGFSGDIALASKPTWAY